MGPPTAWVRSSSSVTIMGLLVGEMGPIKGPVASVGACNVQVPVSADVSRVYRTGNLAKMHHTLQAKRDPKMKAKGKNVVCKHHLIC